MQSTLTHDKHGKPRREAITLALRHFSIGDVPLPCFPIARRFIALALAMADAEELAGNSRLVTALWELAAAWDETFNTHTAIRDSLATGN